MRYRRYLLLALGLALLVVGRAAAHASLSIATPAAGSSVAESPSEIVLVFTETIDPAFSQVQLINSQGQVVAPGPGSRDPRSDVTLRLPVTLLPRDTYTAVWRVRSLVDGHITEGSVPFGVGVPAAEQVVLPPPGAPDPALPPPPLLSSTLRWLVLLGLALLAGPLIFGLLVWQPAAQRAGAQIDAAAATALLGRLTVRQMRVGGAVYLVALVGLLLAQAAEAAGISLFAALGGPVWSLFRGSNGLIWGGRLLLGIVLLGLAPRLGFPDARWRGGVAFAAALLLLTSLHSHAAALVDGRLVALLLDWLHLLAAVAWLGGLGLMLGFAQAALREQPGAIPLRLLVQRFSSLALLCVAVLAITGLGSSALQVGQLDLLNRTTYGRALLVKLGLFGLMLGLAAVNLLGIGPRLRRGRPAAGRRLPHTVRGELVAGALVLLAVGVMTSIAPSQTAWQERQQLGRRFAFSQDQVDVVLWVSPGRSGSNTIAVDVLDDRPRAEAVPAEVDIRMEPRDMSRPQIEITTTETLQRRFTVTGSHFSTPGEYAVEVIVRRPGFNDVTQRLPVVIAAAARADGPAAPQATGELIARARQTYEANCLACHGGDLKGDGPLAAGLVPPPANLTAPHFDDHPDSQIYAWIAKGFPGSAMPAFEHRISEEQIWELVAYLRYQRAKEKARGQ